MKECIILAGGLGTRLQPVVKDIPKCMANIAGKPFLHYIFQYLADQKFEHIVLALGYKSEVVIKWIESLNFPFQISYVIEKEALGTGGAIKYASDKIKNGSFFVINGDTFFDINTEQLERLHQSVDADITIALKPMVDFDRYGAVVLSGKNRIIQFKEKQFCKNGLINGGIYLIKKQLLETLNLPDKFSFEKDIMEEKISEIKIYGQEQDCYFIDIGIPSDFEKANQDFVKWK